MIAIIGEPNAGKSTLVNRLVGGKVSIVTPKVQTTRFNVRGVCAEGNAQLIFIDTPGIFSAEKKFEKAMVSAAWSGMNDADAVLMLLDAKQGLRERTMQLIYDVRDKIKKPVLLAINKIDKVKKPELIKLAQGCGDLDFFQQIFMVSARKGDGVSDVRKKLASMVPQGEWLFPEDHMSDIPMRLLAAEVTREKIFLKLEQELPYSIFVETEAWEETDTMVKISQAILVEREGQKKIVLGDKGAMIKAIGISARRELEAMLGKKVHLALFVKVKPGWKSERENYQAIGLEYKN